MDLKQKVGFLLFFLPLVLFWEFESNGCNANKDTSKNALLAFSMGETSHFVGNVMI